MGKMDRKLEGWIKAFLKRGGIFDLIQSMMSSLPNYFLSVSYSCYWQANGWDSNTVPQGSKIYQISVVLHIVVL